MCLAGEPKPFDLRNKLRVKNTVVKTPTAAFGGNGHKPGRKLGRTRDGAEAEP